MADAPRELLVRFPDGIVRGCEQVSPWHRFGSEGTMLAWCEATTTLGVDAGVRLIAVRTLDNPVVAVGATIDELEDPNEDVARRVLAAHGGLTALRKRDAIRRLGAEARFIPLAGTGFSSDQEMANSLSQQYRIPTINLAEYEIPRDVLQLVSPSTCRALRVLPVSRSRSRSSSRWSSRPTCARSRSSDAPPA